MDFDKPFIIGIDLGTTNCAVSYVQLEDAANKEKKKIKLFKVPQLIGPGEFAHQSVLPSFLYIPGEYDITEADMAAPWQIDQRRQEDRNFVGIFAREHGASVPARLVSSAKSWLCSDRIDRRGPVLPWGAKEEVRKISPVQATSAYLKHIRKAWNITYGDQDEYYLENQIVIITVPASFDEVARDLTLEASREAGLKNVILLEEPLAAFYAWLISNEQNWSEKVKPNELILVCDVGGGTTDFTLISLKNVDGSPRFERIAVGDHLILGGDNIDISLAEKVRAKVGNTRIDLSPDRRKTLCHQCRKVKEIIFDGSKDSVKITLMGAGSRLIGGTISINVERKDVEEVAFNTFFPVLKNEMGDRTHQNEDAMAPFGLSYEKNPSITSHLMTFLERHRGKVKEMIGKDVPVPDLILFNGGSLKPIILQERIVKAIGNWYQADGMVPPRILESSDLDLSVAFGAAYYGLVKMGKGIKVGSGSPRSYYLGVGRDSGDGSQKRAVCLVERGLEEGSSISLSDHRFEVLANQPVSIDLFSSSFRSGDRLGDIVVIDDTFTILPPIQTVIQYGQKAVQTHLPVAMEGVFTEVGTLSLWCQSMVSAHRWQLQFQLRGDRGPITVPEEQILDVTLIDNVKASIRDAFGKNSAPEELDQIVREITDIADLPKERWSLNLLRQISDELLEQIKNRGGSVFHEIRWLNLLGFCLRPGFGDGFDPYRIQKLWKIYPKGPLHSKKVQVRSEWWILWRRVGGGLKPGQQRQFFQDVVTEFISKKGSALKISEQERLEIWMAIANMELLHVKDKIKIGKALLEEMKPKKVKSQEIWALSRIGAREPLYASVDRIIPSEEVIRWISYLIAQEWKNPKAVGNCILQMARKTGDQVRDIPPNIIAGIESYLQKNGWTPSEMRLLHEIIPIERGEEQALFGESLPSGVRLSICSEGRS